MAEIIVGATGIASHSEGKDTVAYGDFSHAEGEESQSQGIASHSEGKSTSIGAYSHSEGQDTFAVGENSHSEGKDTAAIGKNSHASGFGTIAKSDNSFALGSYNKGKDDTILEIGNGVSENERKNAFEVTQEGLVLAYVEKSLIDNYEKSLVTKEWVEEKTGQLISVSSNNKRGWRLKGYDDNYYGEIGKYAVDLSKNDVGENGGATGDYSFACGRNVIASNENSVAIGRFNTGKENNIFEFGIGKSNANRKNALEIDYSGLIKAPEATIPKINYDKNTDEKVLVTKEWVQNLTKPFIDVFKDIERKKAILTPVTFDAINFDFIIKENVNKIFLENVTKIIPGKSGIISIKNFSGNDCTVTFDSRYIGFNRSITLENLNMLVINYYVIDENNVLLEKKIKTRKFHADLATSAKDVLIVNDYEDTLII